MKKIKLLKVKAELFMWKLIYKVRLNCINLCLTREGGLKMTIKAYMAIAKQMTCMSQIHELEES